jgi:mycothiol system anti-sigma-R factor
MNCEEIANLKDAYLDGELDPHTSQRVEQHLRNCGNCQEAYQVESALARAIGQAAPYYKAPSELRERIQSSLREESGVEFAQSVPWRNKRSVRGDSRSTFAEMPWNWLALAAALILAAIIAANLVPRLQPPGNDQLLATQLIASHARSLMANHLTDVASSDQHTVKPWLDTKLDFAPPVVDLGNDGFPLFGGRLDYLVNRPVAALIYQRRKHFINLFVWPVESGTVRSDKAMTRQGYQLVHWSDSDFNYWAVSDVSMDDLQTFKQLFDKNTPHR